MSSIKANMQYIRERLKENSCETIIWLLNFLPYIAGYPLLTKKINKLFWIIHTALAFYVYIVGTTVYQMYYADGYLDAINSFFNIYVLILIIITSWWWFEKRDDLNDILQLVQENDDLVAASGRYPDKHQKLLKNIKIIVLLCYMFHFVNDVLIFIPTRTIGLDNFATASCVGLEPLTSSPNREICVAILAAQELVCVITVGSYDAILIFLFAHTTSLFLLLDEEMKGFQEVAMKYDGTLNKRTNIVSYLRGLIRRHTLVLRTVAKLQRIYNTTIGIGFLLDALLLCLFFVMPLDDCSNFAPLIFHCVFVFFLYCFQGQRLTTASEKFEMAVYCCGWENLHVKEQKCILLMLILAQKPVIIYAASVIPIRIHTFANTMQSIYKFVTVFRV